MANPETRRRRVVGAPQVADVWSIDVAAAEPTENAGELRLRYRGDSDSHLVRGLVAITIALYSGRTPREIISVDAPAIFRELGLEQHLTPQRSNGVKSMIARIRADAVSAL